ncbi:hypothetical protein [Georgenia faecalis]|uniref:Integral membrane protein n=1 Tax=Georgenia faecalis TaxID=2483799 RepID=A0ABV9D8I3_9MICO|nr:hypothetical protein [Georgenia faecalis]
MATLYSVLVVLHLIGWAIVLGGTLTNLRPPRIAKGVLHGALTALVTGLLLVGLASGPLDYDLNHVKIGVKLVIAVVVTALVVVASRRKERVTTGMVGSIAALTAVNVALAVLWR